MSFTNRLSFGCVALTTFNFKSDALKILNLAYDNGITSFDTAPLYGQGYSERVLGSFLKGKREKIAVSTKVGLGLIKPNRIPSTIALPLYAIKKLMNNKKTKKVSFSLEASKPLVFRRIEKSYVEQSLHQSLNSLNSDYIDNYLFHEALPIFFTDEALQFLIDAKNAGMIRQIGVAAGSVNYNNIKHLENIDILQYEYNWVQQTDQLQLTYPHLQHNFHSVLKPLFFIKNRKEDAAQLAGLLLSQATRKNISNGKVLFSTSNKERLMVNLKSYEKAQSYDDAELYNLIKSFLD